MSLASSAVAPEQGPETPSPGLGAEHVERGGAERLEPGRVEILIVDDTERNLAALEAVLSDLDAHVVRARSGADALRALLRQDFALILLDVRMPGIDGFETAELIRARDRSRVTPIIFLTAFDRSREQEMRGYGLGAVDFLSKPIVPEVLRGKVAVLIELHRKTQEVRRQAALLEETQRRENERHLEAERRRWEQESLRVQVQREREAAEALAAANARLRLLSDTARDLVLTTDPAAFAPALFARVADDLGLEVGAWFVAEEGGLRLRDHAPVVPEVEAVLERLAAAGGALARAVASRERVLLDAGEAALGGVLDACAAFPVAVRARCYGVLAFGTRSRKAIDAEVLSALGVVAHAVAVTLERWDLVQELRDRAAELKDADARKDQFLAMLGHELRNPLAPVLNAVTLVLQRERGDPVLDRVVTAADRQIHYMTRLLDDLLDVSRIRNGKFELKRAQIDLREAIRDALHATEVQVAARGHALAVSLPEEPLPVDGDPVRLSQIVGNLVHNAAKYTERGGHLGIEAGRDGGEAVVRVRDDGIGIDPAMLPRVFEMFVQLDTATDRAPGGLGLGLTLVRSLVEMHGGTVVARSEGRGRGSEFEVRLPALAAARLEATGAPATEPAPRTGGRRALDIVLVEDNADIRDSLRALLEHRGHAVLEAPDGRSGIDLIRSRPPHVALVDIGLPGVDGYQVARELRQASCTARLIAMTGYGRPEDRRLALEAGFDAHLVKPVDFAALTALLEAVP